jgi:pimeloyl-ACP methyl ester carboxylesterase
MIGLGQGTHKAPDCRAASIRRLPARVNGLRLADVRRVRRDALALLRQFEGKQEMKDATALKATSKDGTVIGFDKAGSGPLVVIVNGALGYRDFYGDKELAQILSREFTVVIYDRRGRGESNDTLPNGIDREIEDIEALIDSSGGRASLYGVSSGAALALKAAAKLGRKVTKLAMYEPPYSMGDAARQEHARATHRLNNCLAAGDRSGAVSVFMGNFMTDEETQDFRKANQQEWAIMEAVAPTLAYDYAIMAEQAPPLHRPAGAARSPGL